MLASCRVENIHRTPSREENEARIGTDREQREGSAMTETMKDGLGLVVLIGMITAATMWGGLIG